MKINLLSLIVIIAITVSWTYFADNQSPENRLLKTAPDFDYVTLEEKKGQLKNHKGDVVLLHFWATWCAPCLVEFPTLMALAEEESDNITVLAVAVEDKPENIEKFLKKIKGGIPENVHIILDPNKDISETLYQTIKLPETYLISRDSEIFERIAGAQENWNSGAWKDKISRLSGE